MSLRARATSVLIVALAITRLSSARTQEPHSRIDLAADLDDDDENGVADRDDATPPLSDLRPLVLPRTPVTLAFSGPIKVRVDGDALVAPRTIRDARARVTVQGLGEGEGRITLTAEGGAASEMRVVVHAITFEANGRALDATTDALGTTHTVPNDAHFVDDSQPESAFRVRIGPLETSPRIALRRIRRGDEAAREHIALEVPLSGEGVRTTPSLRLVTAELDAEAPLASARLLRVALRDRVDAELQTPTGTIAQSIRVGRPPREDGPLAARLVSLRVRVLDEPSTSLVRTLRADVETLTRRQIALANEIFAPCAIAFETSSLEIVGAPVPSLVTFGDGDGLPASGGAVRISVDGRALPSLETARGETPTAIARRLATYLREAGFDPALHVLPRGERAHDNAAELLVRHTDGTPARVALVEDTDARLGVHVATVMLDDGLLEFDNATAATGTREERALALVLGDADPRTMDIFVVERFTRGMRVGEAFVSRDGGPLAGTVILDFRALAWSELAFTLAHELAHVLLDQALHPSDLGTEVSTSLLSSGRARGDLRGPRRLLPEQCARMRSASAAMLGRREPF